MVEPQSQQKSFSLALMSSVRSLTKGRWRWALVVMVGTQMPNFSIYKDYTSEVVPRLFTAGGVIGVILTSSTIPQVVRTSEGRIGSLSWATKGRMFAVITPKAAGYKAIQYGLMREMKAVLDPVVGPAASKVIAFGAIGTLFQSWIPSSAQQP